MKNITVIRNAKWNCNAIYHIVYLRVEDICRSTQEMLRTNVLVQYPHPSHSNATKRMHWLYLLLAVSIIFISFVYIGKCGLYDWSFVGLYFATFYIANYRRSMLTKQLFPKFKFRVSNTATKITTSLHAFCTNVRNVLTLRVRIHEVWGHIVKLVTPKVEMRIPYK